MGKWDTSIDGGIRRRDLLISGGVTMLAGCSRLTDQDNGENGPEDNDFDAVYAHNYRSAQAAVDATIGDDKNLVVFLREYGPWGEFTIPPTDNLTLWSPNQAEIHTNQPDEPSTSNTIINSPYHHNDYDEDHFRSQVTTLSGPVDSGDRWLPVHNIEPFEPGEIVQITDPNNPWEEHSRAGGNTSELAVVTRIDGERDSLVLGTGDVDDDSNIGGITFNYNEDSEVHQFNWPAQNVHLEGLKLVGGMDIEEIDNTGPWSEDGLDTGRIRNCTVNNVHFERIPDSGIRNVEFYNHTYSDIKFEHCGHYGFNPTSFGANMLVVGCMGNHIGRYFATNGASGDERYAPLRNITYASCHAKRCSDAFASHPNIYNITYKNCTATDCYQGFKARGQRVTYDGLTLNNCRRIGQTGYNFSGLTVRNVTVDALTDRGFWFSPAGDGDGEDPTISNVTIENIVTEDVGGDFFRFSSPQDGGEVHLESWIIKNIDIKNLNGNDLFRGLDRDSITEINGYWSIRNNHIVDANVIWSENAASVDGTVVLKGNSFIGGNPTIEMENTDYLVGHDNLAIDTSIRVDEDDTKEWSNNSET